MSTAKDERVPELTLGWRLKMALAHGGLHREEMAIHLGVDPGTLSRWMADRGAPPKRAYLQMWALATEVDPDWLEHGKGSSAVPPPPRPEGIGFRDELAALTESKRGRTRRGPNTARYLAAA